METKQIILTGLIFLFVFSVATSFAPVAKAQTTYYIYALTGPYDDASGNTLYCANGSAANVLVTVHLPNAISKTFILSGGFYLYNSSAYSPNVNPLYFSFDIIDNSSGTPVVCHREYWLDPTETSGNILVFGTITPQNYIISFLDYTGLLKNYPYIEAKIINGPYTNEIVDKQIIDAQNSVIMDLLQGQRYQILYGDGTTWNIYGDIIPTSVTGIQLVLRGITFSQNTLLLYEYTHAYAIRDFLNPDGAITVSYEDLTNKTNSVIVSINDTSTNTEAFSGTFTDQTFSYTWNNVPNATNYEVTITVNHQTLGNFDFKQYLAGEYTKPTAPLSLDFLGSSFGISTAVIIPALLIIFVAGCFSELTSEVAAILTVLIAIILSALGLIDIPQAAIISALGLAVMAGIVTARKRMQYT